jgi:hypothetical protein
VKYSSVAIEIPRFPSEILHEIDPEMSLSTGINERHVMPQEVKRLFGIRYL